MEKNPIKPKLIICPGEQNQILEIPHFLHPRLGDFELGFENFENLLCPDLTFFWTWNVRNQILKMANLTFRNTEKKFTDPRKKLHYPQHCK